MLVLTVMSLPRSLRIAQIRIPRAAFSGSSFGVFRNSSNFSARRCSQVPLARSSSLWKLIRSSPRKIQRRTLARTSQTEPDSPTLQAKTFIINIGHDAEIANGVIQALEESGIRGEALLQMVHKLAGRWEVGEDEGLEALVASVQQNLARTEGRQRIKLWCVPANAWRSKESDAADFADIVETTKERDASIARAFSVEAMSGLSLTDVAKFGDGEGASTLGESIECACSGIMACSTCHVVVDPEWYKVVGEPCEAEQDMLDLAYAPRRTSRLGCQIILTEEMDGMVVRLPGGANNLMDFVPFED